MRVPVSWLRELVSLDVPTAELAERLSMTGTAVDKIDRTGGRVRNVVVASVLEVGDVAESQKLCVAQVDAGPHGRFQVLAGAKNFKAGDTVAFAKPGATVTTLDGPVGVRTMLGRYESQGMLCSAKELGISEDHEGILILDPGTQLGAEVAAMLHLDDEVLELEIYPNRPDLLSVAGLAREAALLFGGELHHTVREPDEQGGDAASLTSVEIADRSGCPRYLARVIDDVAFGPSPALVQARLTACGFRPLGNLVDATNYVLLATGQPLHAFDLDTLDGERIVVRRARDGERLVTLDGTARQLHPDDLVIADASDAQAIAGVMGGERSEVGPRTRRVLLESAYFDPTSIARTARRHRMRTEASARFERGADPEAVPAAASLCADLLHKWAGGRVAVGAIDAGSAPPRRRVRLRRDRATALLGLQIPQGDTDRYLRGLGCDVNGTDGVVDVVTPSWRPDLEREIDLVEEMVRIHGYEKVPLTLPAGQRGFLTREQLYRRRVRDVLLGAGLSEATLTSFVATADLSLSGSGFAVQVTNPMTVDQEHVRPSLIPGLLHAARYNVAQGTTSVRLFEMGVVFTAWPDSQDLPSQELRVGAVLTGHAGGDSWHTAGRPVDAYDAKGVVELLLAELGIRGWTVGPCDETPFHPGRAGTVVIGAQAVGSFGEVRPSVREAFDLTGGVALVELALDGVLASAAAELSVVELPRFPATTRDLAVLVDEDVAAQDAESAISSSAGPYLESVTLLDVYRGEQVPEGRKSLAYRLTFRALDRTLTSAEADVARERAVATLRERHSGEVR